MSGVRLYLRQSDPLWSGLQLGFGASTIGRGGCLLMAVLAAAHERGSKPASFGPREANELFKRVGAFRLPDGTVGGSNLVIHIAAAAVGLEAPYEARSMGNAGDPALVGALERALELGMAIVHVDHDARRAGGDAAPDHFVLAYAREQIVNGTIEAVCYDPAPREQRDRRLRLPIPELAAQVRWSAKDTRDYAVRAVRPIL